MLIPTTDKPFVELSETSFRARTESESGERVNSILELSERMCQCANVLMCQCYLEISNLEQSETNS